MFKLVGKKRENRSKTLVKQGRRKGTLPAVVYGKKQESTPISINEADFKKILQQVEKGFLSTEVIDLEVEKEKHKVLVKEIQYHPTTYKVLHIDFQTLNDTPIKVNIPIHYTHIDECIGVKLGGSLRPVLRKVRVSCLPSDLPKKFEIDVSKMVMYEKKKLSDISYGEKVKPITDVNQVAIVVSKR